MTELVSRHLFSLTLPPASYQAVGDVGIGERRIGLVSGETTFQGERLRGTVLPGGADWILVRPDGVVTLDVRLGLKTDDGAVIAFTYRGLRHAGPEVMAKLDRGEAVEPSAYYMRIVGTFETAAPHYQWLARLFAVGVGSRSASGARYEIYEIA